jgi:hypothetical protein
MSLMGGVVAAATLAAASVSAGVGARASVIYQSISNLYATPQSALCSECLSNGQFIGEFFSLGSSAVAQSLTFVVGGTFVPYTLAFTVDIFQDAGGNTLGTDLYEQTFSSYARDVPTANTSVLSVNLGSVALSAGSYDIFVWNPGIGAIPEFGGLGAGNQIKVQTTAYQNAFGQFVALPLSSGDGYSYTDPGYYDTGIQLSSTPVSSIPEASTWALMLVGFAGLGFAGFRTSRKAAAIA